ncbi:MAG: FtsQ-type POTRA domain-containing protein [Deltaproteobacteria bacterium]|nr:FtsQ-type POTRA domain-containing protein [Deltaproteobacteria bacterium]
MGSRNKPLSRKTVRRKSAVKRRDAGRPLRETAAKSWWVLRGVIAGLTMVSLIYGGWLGGNALIDLPALSVKRIVVTGSRDVGRGKIIMTSGVQEGTPLLRVDLADVLKRVEKLPQVRSAVVVRQLPDTLEINIQERHPVAVIMGRGYPVVDMDGVVLRKSGRYPGGMPLITGLSGDWNPGDRAADAEGALRVLRSLEVSGLLGPDAISEIRVKNERMVLVALVKTGITLVMSPDGSKDELNRLARLMASKHFDTRAAGYDLRFEGRIIKMPGRNDGVNRKSTASGLGGIRHGQG